MSANVTPKNSPNHGHDGADWRSLLRHSANSVFLEANFLGPADDAESGGHRPDETQEAITNTQGLLFHDPVQLISTDRNSEIPELLIALDEARARGYYTAGYFSYEALLVGGPSQPGSGLPLAQFGIYTEPLHIRTDFQTDSMYPSGDDRKLHENGTFAKASYSLKECETSRADAGRIRFLHDLKRIRQHLEEGDCYQVNYTQESQYHFSGDIVALYERLRLLQPGIYRGLLQFENGTLLSLSPELFFRLEKSNSRDTIESRPIKGTIARSADPVEDRALRQELIESEKTRAENVMIADLLRNDLGMICIPGSIKAEPLFVIETLPTLHQMHSRISGQPLKEIGDSLYRSVFPALFPCGSVTGAPKKAAQSVIACLEKRHRGAYTGSMGYATPLNKVAESGTTEAVFNVMIRTMQISKNGNARFGAGCGIVWDSDAEAEWNEKELKRAFLGSALDGFAIIETFYIIDGRIPLLHAHMIRLKAALDYFQISPRKLRATRDRLNRFLKGNPAGPFRARLTADRDGNFTFQTFSLNAHMNRIGSGTKKLRVFVSPKRIFSGNPFRSFKTTMRELYDSEYARALNIGYDEVLFRNEAGQMVEGSRNNILMRLKDGRWMTPPAKTGALPGVYLKTLAERCAHKITFKDAEESLLRHAKMIYLCNAVRGLQRISEIVEEGVVIYSHVR